MHLYPEALGILEGSDWQMEEWGNRANVRMAGGGTVVLRMFGYSMEQHARFSLKEIYIHNAVYTTTLIL